jgi:long-chain acyl-CoA synthetase
MHFKLFSSELNKYLKNIAIIDDKDFTLTYNDLFYHSNTLNSNLNEKSLIFTLCENTIGSIIGYFTFLNNRHVQLMLDSSIDPIKLQNLISLYNPHYLWVPNTALEFFFNSTIIFSNWNYSLIRSSTTTVLMHENLSLLLTTSGSTGSPKLVRLSFSNILSNAKSIAQYLNITDLERPITSLPMNYSYGLSVINSHLINGATILLTNFSVVQKEFWNFVKNKKATSIAGVPFTYQMLKMLRFTNMDLPYLKTLTQAGGKLSSNLVKEYYDYAIENSKDFIVMYGQTEATARMSYLPFNMSQKKYESIGIPIPGGKFSLMDLQEKTEIHQSNIEGELMYQGPNVSLGYANNVTDLAKGDENLGILYTGDIAFKDEDGYYFITGRIKRFIKIYGNRVNLDEIEQFILSKNIECACDGVDDKMTIFTTNKNKVEEILNLLTSILKLNFRAFEIRIISEIPKNSTGKVLYTQLKDL